MSDLVEREGAGIVVADLDDRAECWQLLRMQLARTGDREFRRQGIDHSDIIAGLEARRGDQRFAAGPVQGVFDLAEAVGGVDVDQDHPGLGGGELGDDPLGVIRRPDAGAIPRLQAERDQAGGKGVDCAPSSDQVQLMFCWWTISPGRSPQRATVRSKCAPIVSPIIASPEAPCA